MRSICRHQLLRSLRAHQNSSYQKKILKDQNAQDTARVVSVPYRLRLPFPSNRLLNLAKLKSVIWLPLSINRVLDLRKLRSAIQNQSLRSLVATLYDQQSAQFNNIKESDIGSICRHQLFCSLRAHQHSSTPKVILEEHKAQTTARVVSVTYSFWLPLLINRVLNLTNLRNVISDQYGESSCFDL